MTTRTYTKFDGDKSPHYVASPKTAEIVNLAIRLGRPLLVEGEAGCGKTQLAHAIAQELTVPCVTVTVKSTSQAKDLLYRFDALRRLQDAQDPQNMDARNVYPYVDLEPLGHAIQAGQPCVVLIDEVDKADIDFPNDLLDVLDRFEFDIEDVPRSEDAACRSKHGFGRHVQAAADGARPIVLITSNREKQLPEPFLRRCMYLQLDFPTDAKLLGKIVKKNLAAGPDQISDALLEGVVARFLEVRERGSDLKKPPATSELLDWVRVLHWQGRSADVVSAEKLNEIDQAVLFKLRKDIETYRARAKQEEAGGG